MSRPFPERAATLVCSAVIFVSGCSLLAGCGLLGGDETVGGTYVFSNAYGYEETIVVRPDFEEHLRFEVAGQVVIEERDGTLSGEGSCTKTIISLRLPDSLEQRTESTAGVTFTGTRSGNRLVDVDLTGCAYPRTMTGEVRGGRIVLETDLDFPVSRGTTLISDRFGDPTRLEMTRSDS
ncbi:MAG: hypothetical protein ACI80V_001896 [Rhodothermales bacterium]